LPKYTQENRLIQIATPLGKDILLLQGFTGREEVSRPFRFDLRLLSEDRAIGFDKIVGKSVSIMMLLPDETERYINGVVSQFTQGGSSQNLAHYHLTLVPWLWLLTRTSDCRIFQNQSVPDIIETVFKDFGFADFKSRLQATYEPREYCVQYRETAFAFVSRLMEEEGIFYFFEHEEDKHTLVLADSPNEFKPCPYQPTAVYSSDRGAENLGNVIRDWQLSQEVRPGKFTLGDFDFIKPRLDLTSTAEGKSKFEMYDYPGSYTTRNDGERLAGIRIQEQETPIITIEGVSDCMGFASGYRFDLKGHYRRDLNKSYALLSVEHSADVGDNYETADKHSFNYENKFLCVPHPTPYRPTRETPVPVVHGTQTAIIVGPAGQEIHSDQYGRVKVQFHWDRRGKYDDKSSCWVRVSQNWAGKRWGAMFLPRIGQEVIVDFLEGDPDRPLITGRVYNGESMPPYALPDEQTKSAIKSYSSKGGDGFNELRFEDLKGEEQIFVHGQKDLDVRILNDRREWIGQDRHLFVKRDKLEQVERDEHIVVKRDLVEDVTRDHNLKVSGKQAIKIAKSHSLEVSGDVIEEFKSNHSEQVTKNYYLKGMNVVIEAMTGLTIKVGGNFVTINSGGVFIKGTMVHINSAGAALSGSAGALVAPIAAAVAALAAEADPGAAAEAFAAKTAQITPYELNRVSFTSSHDPNSEENKEKKSWIEIELVDEADKPVAGEPYLIKLPDGETVASGTLDEKGFARVDAIDPGSCQITFPNLDKDAWD
jgi:type VI secretion system secreted protein VgrG